MEDKLFILIVLVFSMLFSSQFLTVSTKSMCVDKAPTEVNETHPSQNTNWTDIEQLTNVTSFCDVGTLEIECRDNKNESIGAARNTSVYIAKCNTIIGLFCHPHGNEICPDFAAFYTCRCPATTATERSANVHYSTRSRDGNTSSMNTRTTTKPALATESSSTHIHEATCGYFLLLLTTLLAIQR